MPLTYAIAKTGLFPAQNRRRRELQTTTEVMAFMGIFASATVPSNFIPCDGRLLQINTNQAFFSLLGTTYGGNGAHNPFYVGDRLRSAEFTTQLHFVLPNPFTHSGQTTFAVPDLRGRRAVGVGTNYAIGSKYGSETAVLNFMTLAPHSHPTPLGEATTTNGDGLGFDNMDPSLTLQYIIAVVGDVPVPARRRGLVGEEDAEGIEMRRLETGSPWLGEIALFAGSLIPKNWMACNGQLLSTSTYSALFQLLGNRYGGDNTTTFALPGTFRRLSAIQSLLAPSGHHLS